MDKALRSPGMAGFAFEAISPALFELRAELVGPRASLHLRTALSKLALQTGLDPARIDVQQCIALDFETLRSAQQALGGDRLDCESYLAKHIIGALALVAHQRSLWEAELPDVVADLSELVDILPRQWGELCALAVPLCEDLLGVEQRAGAQFLLDGYEVFEPIGRGGMGQIRRARDHSSGQWVAIKFLSSIFQSEEIISRFDREGRLLNSLDHPGVAKYFGQGVLNSMGSQVPYLVMELLQGVSPLEYAQQHQLDERQCLELFLKICAAVEHAHSKGVIHRDLHPGNILVTAEGQPKVLDFGIAHHLQDQDPRLTQPGQVFGVAAYLSPELAAGQAKEADVRMDVYALGAILFELLSGQTPHDLEGTSLHLAWSSVASVEGRHLRQVLPKVDKRLEGILARALTFDVKERYATLHAFVGDLHAYLNNEQLKAPELTLGHMASVLVRRHCGKVVLGLLALSLFLASNLWALWSRQQALAAGRAHERSRAEVLELARLSMDALMESWEHEGPRPYVLDSVSALRSQVLAMRADGGPQFAGLRADLDKLEGEWDFSRANYDLAMLHFTKAEAILGAHLAANESMPELQAKRSVLLVRIGDTAMMRGQRPEALDFYARALGIDKRLLEDSGTPPDLQLLDNYCWSLIRRIECLMEVGDCQRAEEFSLEARHEVERLVALSPDRAHSSFAHARLLNRQIRIAQRLGHPAGGLLDLAESALQSSRLANQLDPGRVGFELGVDLALRTLAEVLAEIDSERSSWVQRELPER